MTDTPHSPVHLSRATPPSPASAASSDRPVRLQGLAPVTSATTVLLVLGSFPGALSLATRQYYAHPQNHFWRILQAVWPNTGLSLTDSYESRLDWLLARGLGLWDVYASCEREGSLDSRIRNAEPNDFTALARGLPALRGIAHNGAESFRHARHAQALDLPVHRLPSTSPANASWRFERKLDAWRDVLAFHGLA